MAFVPFRPKFLRALLMTPPASGDSANKALPGVLKVLYEFWGFCVNGDNSLTIPGGFSTSHVTGTYLEQPTGFQSGSTVLLASGTDGYTSQSMPYFNTLSSVFTTSSVGNYIVAWKSGSTSTDDSIYRIVSFINSSSVVIDPTSGGTPIGSSGSVPALTNRSSINYRVIDLNACRDLTTYRQGQHMVLQFNGAADVNVGQRLSQAKILYRGHQGGTTPTDVGSLAIILSPSGSWNGSTFVSESYGEIASETTIGGSSGSPTWVAGFSAGSNQTVTIIADKTAIILYLGGDAYAGAFSGPSSLVIEIPQRLYPQANDPNLICARNSGGFGASHASAIGYGDAHRFFPSPYDSLLRRWPIMIHGYVNSYWTTTYAASGAAYNSNVAQYNFFYNPIIKKFVSSDGVLGMCTVSGQTSASGQFSLCRARVRTVRYCSTLVPRYQRIGDAEGDRWIVAGSGVMYPWDHSIVPNNRLFRP